MRKKNSKCCFSAHEYLLQLVEDLGNSRQVLESALLERCIFNPSIFSSGVLKGKKSLVASFNEAIHT